MFKVKINIHVCVCTTSPLPYHPHLKLVNLPISLFAQFLILIETSDYKGPSRSLDSAPLQCKQPVKWSSSTPSAFEDWWGCCKPNWQHNPSFFRSGRNNLQGKKKKKAFQKCLVSALSLMCCLFCLFVYFNAGALAQPEMFILIVQLCKKRDLLKLRSFRHCRKQQPACHGPVFLDVRVLKAQAAKASLVALWSAGIGGCL